MAEKKKPEAPFRAVCFTRNMGECKSVDELIMWGQHRRAALAMKLTACVMYVERGTKNGLPHIQGYMRTHDSHRLSWWIKQLEGAHVERRKGSEQEAAEYCRKDANEPGSVLIADYGTETKVPEVINGDVTLTTIHMLLKGNRTYQIFKKFPKFYFNQARKIKDLEADIEGWNQMGVDLSDVDGMPSETNIPQVMNPPPKGNFCPIQDGYHFPPGEDDLPCLTLKQTRPSTPLPLPANQLIGGKRQKLDSDTASVEIVDDDEEED